MADTSNKPETVFKGDASHVGALDIDAPLATSSTATCDYYIEQYGQAAKKAAEHGDPQSAEAYRFLQVLVGFSPSFDTPSQPFVPMWQMDGKRSLIPSDLTAPDIEVVRALAAKAKDYALRARLHDVLWELKKDHVAGAEAAACYAASGEKLHTSGEWTYAVTSFKRGLYLASKFGRNKPLFENIGKTIVTAAKRAATSEDAFHCLALMRLLIAPRLGDPAEFAQLSASKATAAEAQGDPHTAHEYWSIEAEWRKLAKDIPGEQKARLAAAEAAVNRAEKRTQEKDASFMAGAFLMGKAIEEMRRAGATKERIQELRQKMNDWQQRSLNEYQTFSTEFNITDMVLAARDYVKEKAFPNAILKLAFGYELADPAKVKEAVRKNAQQAPLTYLMGAAIVDQKGRTTAREESLLNLSGEALNAALETEAFSHAAQYEWPLRVDGFIEPGRTQILNDHKPTYQDLMAIVCNNPFIPTGHEGIFLRGLHAGFHGDFVVAAHLLTPQIENSLRHVLESQGVDVSNLESDGTQPVKMLGGIFGFPETKRIFGEPLCFELRGCLIEKTGYDFRNRVAHGFIHEGECYTTPGITVWWLVLRICLTPLAQLLEAQHGAPKTGERPAQGGDVSGPPKETT